MSVEGLQLFYVSRSKAKQLLIKTVTSIEPEIGRQAVTNIANELDNEELEKELNNYTDYADCKLYYKITESE